MTVTAAPRPEEIHADITSAAQARAKGRDIWIRSRTNALAHKLEASRVGLWANGAFCLETIFLVIPIVCVALSLQLLTTPTVPATGSPPQEGQTATMQILSSPSRVAALLGIIAIVSNGIALLVNIIANRFQWSERRLQHQNLLASYQLIAQKARRLDNSDGLAPSEVNHLCRHLEETFEIYKTTGIEPDDNTFKKAQNVLLGLKTYPFGITVDQLK